MTKRARVIHGSGNVFKDVGLPDAEELALKADIVIKLAKLIELKGLSQSKAAAITGIAQPDLSKLLRGHFAGFSMDRLVGSAGPLMALSGHFFLHRECPLSGVKRTCRRSPEQMGR